MSISSPIPSLQDFHVVKSHVDKVTEEQGFAVTSFGFMFLALDLILDLQEDEIRDAITDTSFLKQESALSGHDRGIDAVYIDDSQKPATVHLFTFKYTEEHRRTSNNFPASEIDKIWAFVTSILVKNEDLESEVNPLLFQKVNDIWQLFTKESPTFVIHVCSNFYYGFESSEQQRFEREIGKFSNFSISYHKMLDFVNLLVKRNKQIVNAKLRAIDRNFFEKSEGDIRALVVEVDARELLKIVVDNAVLRDATDLVDYDPLRQCSILGDAFEDNVRVFRERSPINRNIKQTAVGDDAYRFFYYNNGITITCSHFDYPRSFRGPIITLENFQIVNGSQTIHALFAAFKEKQDQFESISLLCRIYETRNEKLSVSIAEFTNSQNPVTSRDIRSNDYIQKKLESELEAYGFFYERKKGQHASLPKDKRIDAEKAGQALLSLFAGGPAEAKARKQRIFGERYGEVFDDEVNADSVLLATSLFQEIETRKLQRQRELLADGTDYELESFIVHASYYILFTLGQFAKKAGVSLKYDKRSEIITFYGSAVSLLRAAVIEGRAKAESKGSFSQRIFFVSSQPKTYVEKNLMD